jgi:integrase
MNYVFTSAHGTPIYPRNVNRSLKAILKRAGIPHLRVHDLRHSAATLAIADGVPAPYVQKMLGHSDVRTTLSVYTKIVPSVLQQATGTLDRVTEMPQNSVVTDKVTDTKKKRAKKESVTR